MSVLLLFNLFESLIISFTFSKVPSPIDVPDVTYTGRTMTLTCGPPPNNDVGQISGSEWKFNEREIKGDNRIQIIDSGMRSQLIVNNVILADVGKSKLNLLTDNIAKKNTPKKS